jgi:hypothetical protein
MGATVQYLFQRMRYIKQVQKNCFLIGRLRWKIQNATFNLDYCKVQGDLNPQVLIIQQASYSNLYECLTLNTDSLVQKLSIFLLQAN